MILCSAAHVVGGTIDARGNLRDSVWLPGGSRVVFGRRVLCRQATKNEVCFRPWGGNSSLDGDEEMEVTEMRYSHDITLQGSTGTTAQGKELEQSK